MVGFVVVGARGVVVWQSAECEWFEAFLRWCRGRRLLLCVRRSLCGLCVVFTTTGWCEVSIFVVVTAVSDVVYNKLSIWFSCDEFFMTIDDVGVVSSGVIGVVFAYFVQSTSTKTNPINVNEFIIYKKGQKNCTNPVSAIKINSVHTFFVSISSSSSVQHFTATID